MSRFNYRVEWSKFLVETFVDCRKSPGWDEIKAAAWDEEDHDYFEMLEEEADKGRLALKEW